MLLAKRYHLFFIMIRIILAIHSLLKILYDSFINIPRFESEYINYSTQKELGQVNIISVCKSYSPFHYDAAFLMHCNSTKVQGCQYICAECNIFGRSAHHWCEASHHLRLVATSFWCPHKCRMMFSLCSKWCSPSVKWCCVLRTQMKKPRSDEVNPRQWTRNKKAFRRIALICS